MADRIGGVKSLTAMYILAAIFLAIVSVGLPEAWMALAVFALVGLTAVKTRWRTTWGAAHLTSAKI